MTIIEFKALLAAHPDESLCFVLPDKTEIPAHFHITEVAFVKKDFIDCGGTRRSLSTCVLQAWIDDNDKNHSLLAGKLAKILSLSDPLFPSQDLPVEVEYEAPYITQFSIASGETTCCDITFYLTTKHTDCLAKDKCGISRPDSHSTGSESCC